MLVRWTAGPTQAVEGLLSHVCDLILGFLVDMSPFCVDAVYGKDRELLLAVCDE